jgi:hypothetical protein
VLHVLADAKNNHDKHAEKTMIDQIPVNDDNPIHVFVLVVRFTKSGLLSASRPCGKTKGLLTGCKSVLANDAKKKGYIVDYVVYSHLIREDDRIERILVKEDINDLITKHDDYETKGQKFSNSGFVDGCLVS